MRTKIHQTVLFLKKKEVLKSRNSSQDTTFEFLEKMPQIFQLSSKNHNLIAEIQSLLPNNLWLIHLIYEKTQAQIFELRETQNLSFLEDKRRWTLKWKFQELIVTRVLFQVMRKDLPSFEKE